MPSPQSSKVMQPTPFQKLTMSYAKRFGHPVPISMSDVPESETIELIKMALETGTPHPAWKRAKEARIAQQKWDEENGASTLVD